MQLFKGTAPLCVLRQTVMLNRACVTKDPHIYENNPVHIYHIHHMWVVCKLTLYRRLCTKINLPLFSPGRWTAEGGGHAGSDVYVTGCPQALTGFCVLQAVSQRCYFASCSSFLPVSSIPRSLSTWCGVLKIDRLRGGIGQCVKCILIVGCELFGWIYVCVHTQRHSHLAVSSLSLFAFWLSHILVIVMFYLPM